MSKNIINTINELRHIPEIATVEHDVCKAIYTALISNYISDEIIDINFDLYLSFVELFNLNSADYHSIIDVIVDKLKEHPVYYMKVCNYFAIQKKKIIKLGA